MKKFLEVLILSGALIVLGIIILSLTEANAKLFNVLSDFGYFSEKFNEKVPLIKSIGFSLGTIIVVIYYRKFYIKMFFILLDVFIVWVFYYVPYETWREYIGFAYPIYTGLILAYIGNIVFKYYISNTRLNNKPIDSAWLQHENQVLKDRLRVIEIKKKITNLKRTGKNGEDWKTLPEKVEQIEKLESELQSIDIPDDVD